MVVGPFCIDSVTSLLCIDKWGNVFERKILLWILFARTRNDSLLWTCSSIIRWMEVQLLVRYPKTPFNFNRLHIIIARICHWYSLVLSP